MNCIYNKQLIIDFQSGEERVGVETSPLFASKTGT